MKNNRNSKQNPLETRIRGCDPTRYRYLCLIAAVQAESDAKEHKKTVLNQNPEIDEIELTDKISKFKARRFDQVFIKSNKLKTETLESLALKAFANSLVPSPRVTKDNYDKIISNINTEHKSSNRNENKKTKTEIGSWGCCTM